MTTGEVELARVEWFNTQDGQPDEPAEELDPPEVATLTATPDGIESFFYVWSPGDPVTASALLTAPWPEVLKHAPAEAIATVVLERQDVIDLIDSATMHNELLDRDRRAYRGE